MISRRGLLAGVLLVGLATFFYLYEVRTVRKREAREVEEKKVFHLEPVDVHRILVTRGEEEILLERTDEGWALRQPVNAPADDTEVESLLSSILEATIEQKLGPSGDLEQYSLEDPEVRLELSREGAETGAGARLRLGAENPISSDFYGIIGEEEDVVLISWQIRQAREVEVLKLRDKQLVKLESWKVNGLELERVGDTLHLVKEGGNWHLESPIRTPADDGTVADLTSHLGRLEARSFPEEDPEDLSRYGLDPPRLKVTLYQDGWMEPRRIEFGGEDGEGNRFARRLDRTAVMVVEESIWPKLTKSIGELRKSGLFDVGRWNIARLDLEDSDGAVSLTKNDDGRWEFEEGEPEAGEVDDLLDAFEEWEATGFIDEGTEEPARFGLDGFRLRAVIWTEDDLEDLELEGEEPARPLELIVGGEAGSGDVYVKEARWPTIYRLPADKVLEVEERIAAIRQRQEAESSSDEATPPSG